MNTSTRAKLDQHAIAARALMFRTVAGGSCEVMRDWVRAFSSLPIPSFNIFQPLTAKGLTDETLADTAAFFYSLDTIYTIELIHDLFPEGADYLDQRHYQALPPQLAMYLDDSFDSSDIHLNPEVVVEPVASVPSLTAFCTLLHQVFDYSLSEIIKFYPVRHLDKEHKSKIHHYLAFIDDQPVGTGTIICTEGVASIWNVCTIDDFRQRGVATTVVHRLLSDAGEHGFQLKMLYSTPYAYRLFDKYGFEMYTQRQWFLPPGLDYED